jgi:two-component system KDP operon response regulator KdpE
MFFTSTCGLMAYLYDRRSKSTGIVETQRDRHRTFSAGYGNDDASTCAGHGMRVDGPLILVVDDEPPIRRLLRSSLAAQRYRILAAENGSGALDRLRLDKPDLVILDLGLPDMDGIEVIRQIRAQSKVPIIVLSSRGDEKGKIEALDLGADDYVTKPFGMGELVARIRAALRHRVQEEGGEPVFQSGDLAVDLVHRLVSVQCREVKLSPKEYDILRLLVLHAGKVLTHRMIMREVWGGAGDIQYLRVYVRQLRQKLEADPDRPRHILTETGVGYRLRSAD